jgi:hypothetical protein
VACRAGTPPAIAAARTARPATQNTVWNLGVKSIQNGSCCGPNPGVTMPESHASNWRASRNPTIPAAADSTSTSTKTCTTMRLRLAPNAQRAANSSWRVTILA